LRILRIEIISGKNNSYTISSIQKYHAAFIYFQDDI